jgi:hypothetical protein
MAKKPGIEGNNASNGTGNTSSNVTRSTVILIICTVNLEGLTSR